MKTVDIIKQTFDLLEDLAKKGVTRVSVNVPPPEHVRSRLQGVFALIPYQSKGNTSDALWRNIDNHGGQYCGNGLGPTKDKKFYWTQSQVKREFFTGHYTYIGQKTNEYRKWECPEVLKVLLDLRGEII